MIRFMTKEAEKLMKVSVHENDFFIIYDDLVFDDIKGDNQMDEREQLLPLFIAAHEWIAGRYTLCWKPCR